MKLLKKQCATCPWRKGSPYADLVPTLELSARTEASRICHSTGSNAINHNTGIPERLCRGARDSQLRMFAATGFITAPTDEAWAAKCREMGIEQDKATTNNKEDKTWKTAH